jgi:hypothetical protein
VTDISTYLARIDRAKTARELGEIENAYYATAAERGWSKGVLQVLDGRRYERAVELTRKSGALTP